MCSSWAASGQVVWLAPQWPYPVGLSHVYKDLWSEAVIMMIIIWEARGSPVPVTFRQVTLPHLAIKCQDSSKSEGDVTPFYLRAGDGLIVQLTWECLGTVVSRKPVVFLNLRVGIHIAKGRKCYLSQMMKVRVRKLCSPRILLLPLPLSVSEAMFHRKWAIS